MKNIIINCYNGDGRSSRSQTLFNNRYYSGVCYSKKSQMKIQEMAFVLIALFLLFSMVFIFYIKTKSSDIEETSYGLKQTKTLAMLEKIAAMPELSCSASLGKESLCIDADKLVIMDSEFRDEYVKLWTGIKEVKVKKIYPEKEEFVLYSSDAQDYESYSAFVRICKQKYDNIAWYQCSIGVVSVKT